MKKKICLLTNNINNFGGIERVISRLSEEWIKKFHVTIVSLYSNQNSPSSFLFHEQIEIVHGGLSLSVSNAEIEQWLTEYFSQNLFGYLITFHPTIGLNVAKIKKQIQPIYWIATEHAEPTSYTWKRRLLNLYVYSQADRMVVLTNVAKKYYQRRGIKKIMRIPNPISFVTEECTNYSRTIIAVGRVEQVKRFDLLVKAFEKLSHKYTEWKLQIIGIGGELDYIKELAKDCKTIEFLGYQSDVKKYLLESSFMVVSSEHESFSLVTTEAMECGLPVVATELAAIQELTEGYEAALFAKQGDYENLAEKMEILMKNQEKIVEMGMQAKQCAKKFHVENIMKLWEKVFIN